MIPAAEIQNSLLPPRIARFDQASVAGGVLPAYDVGGDSSTTPETPMGSGSRWSTRWARATARRSCPRCRSVRWKRAASRRHPRGGGRGDARRTDRGHRRRAVRDRGPGALAHRDRHVGLDLLRPSRSAPRAPGRRGAGARLRPHLPARPRSRTHKLSPWRAAPRPGMRLVLYSDGVSERRRDDGELFGLEGIRDAALNTGNADRKPPSAVCRTPCSRPRIVRCATTPRCSWSRARRPPAE